MSKKTSTPAIQPLGTRVLLRPLEDEAKTASGLLLPETANEKPQTAQVVAIGDDVLNYSKRGQTLSLQVPGD